MLQTKPKRRPSTKELLNLKEVRTKIDQLYIDIGDPPESQLGLRNSLLNTIKFPKEFMNLKKKLPKPNYSYDNASFLPKFIDVDASSEKVENEDENEVLFGSVGGTIDKTKSKVPSKKSSRRCTSYFKNPIDISRNKISMKEKKQIKESMSQIQQVLMNQHKRSPYIPNGISIPSSYLHSSNDNRYDSSLISRLNLPVLSQNNSISRNSPSIRGSIDSSRK